MLTLSVRRALLGLAVATASLAVVAPAGAQYAGNELVLVVTPITPPEGGTISGIGTGCPAGSTVTITLEGVPGILATVTAAADTSYSFTNAQLPPGLTVGGDYNVVASCAGETETAMITIWCANGNEPIGGDCSGNPPVTTTTAGSDTGSTGENPPLAYTGAGATLQIVQLSITLMALGALFLVVGRRREADEAT